MLQPRRMMMMPRCPRCLSVALVCACLAQGVKAPPAPVISWILSAGPVAVGSSTASSTMTVVNTVVGKTHDVAPARKVLYGEHDAPSPENPIFYVWKPPDPSKT